MLCRRGRRTPAEGEALPFSDPVSNEGSTPTNSSEASTAPTDDHLTTALQQQPQTVEQHLNNIPNFSQQPVHQNHLPTTNQSQHTGNQIPEPVNPLQSSVSQLQPTGNQLQLSGNQLQQPVHQLQHPTNPLQHPMNLLQQPVHQMQQSINQLSQSGNQLHPNQFSLNQLSHQVNNTANNFLPQSVNQLQQQTSLSNMTSQHSAGYQNTNYLFQQQQANAFSATAGGLLPPRDNVQIGHEVSPNDKNMKNLFFLIIVFNFEEC